MAKIRDYSYKDVDMLMASKTVAESFGASLSELSTIRANWTNGYATDLINRIDMAIETYLGVDTKKEWRAATSHIIAIHYPAVRDLSFFKAEIDDDFDQHPAMRNEIFKSLGFSRYFRSVQKGNVESLAELLHIFKCNMDEELLSIATSKGLNSVLIDTIIGYANIFADAKVSHESLRDTTREITPEGVALFNRIYGEITDICRIASEYYHYEPQKKDMFNFNKVLTRLGDTLRVVEIPTLTARELFWSRMPTIVGM